MKDMIQVTRQLRKPRCFNPNSFEKTECVGKKLKNIAPNVERMCCAALHVFSTYKNS